jgi:translation initiation factor 4E
MQFAHCEHRGGKFTLRLLKPVSPLLFESLVLALIGDQFDDADGVVGCVLSVRANNEDALSIWTEDEGDIPAIRYVLNLA